MTAPAKRAQRLSDHTALEGKGAGKKIANEIDQLLKRIGLIESLIDDGADFAQLNADLPRVTFTNPVANPYLIDMDQSGTLFDDVEAAAATAIKLPAASLRSHVRNKSACLHYYFKNTSGFPMTIMVGDSAVDTIEVGPTGGGVTSYTLPRDNSTLHLAIVDDRWRAISCKRSTGTRVKRSQFTLANNTPTTISWTSVDSNFADPDGFYSGGTPTRLTIPAGLGGIYMVTAGVDFDQDADGIRSLNLKHKNSGGTTLVDKLSQGLGNATHAVGVQICMISRFAPGDYVELTIYHTAGNNLEVAKDGYTSMEIARTWC